MYIIPGCGQPMLPSGQVTSAYSTTLTSSGATPRRSASAAIASLTPGSSSTSSGTGVAGAAGGVGPSEGRGSVVGCGDGVLPGTVGRGSRGVAVVIGSSEGLVAQPPRSRP